MVSCNNGTNHHKLGYGCPTTCGWTYPVTSGTAPPFVAPRYSQNRRDKLNTEGSGTNHHHETQTSAGVFFMSHLQLISNLVIIHHATPGSLSNSFTDKNNPHAQSHPIFTQKTDPVETNGSVFIDHGSISSSGCPNPMAVPTTLLKDPSIATVTWWLL